MYGNSTFTLIDHARHTGYANGMTIGPDSTFFLINDFDGVRTYKYNGQAFTNTAHLNIDASLNNYSFKTLAFDSSGMVFIPNDGLWAYQFDGSTFVQKDYQFLREGTRCVQLGKDGTIFVAAGEPGLYAYSFNGGSFTEKGHFDPIGWPRDIEIAADGTIFVAAGTDGVYALSFNGSTFTELAQANFGVQDSEVSGIALGKDNIIFLARGEYGLDAYEFTGSSFIRKAWIDEDPKQYYSYDVAVGTDGTVFLADGYSGLYAYSYNTNGFTKTAHINFGGEAKTLTIGADNTIFLSGMYDGLIAYKYTSSTVIGSKSQFIPQQHQLLQNYPNPFNPSTTIDFTLPKSEFTTLKVFNILGKEVANLISAKLQQGTHTYTFDGKNLASGIYYYQIVAGDYKEVKKMILLR
jgi:WD40 repeat protein